MERKKYLELCQKCATLPEGVLGMKMRVPKDCRVTVNGSEYYPVSYTLRFDKTGNAVHDACLHDLRANSVVVVALESVLDWTKGCECETV